MFLTYNYFHDYHGETYDLRRWCLCTGADKWLELQSIAARFFFFDHVFFPTTFVCFCFVFFDHVCLFLLLFFSTRFVCFCFLFFWPRLFVFLSQFFFRPCFCFCQDWSFLGMWNVNTFIKCQYSEHVKTSKAHENLIQDTTYIVPAYQGNPIQVLLQWS